MFGPLLGAAAGRKTKLVRPLRLVQGVGVGALAEVGGVNIHAAVAADDRDRKRLERLCRYIARPPLSLERLETHPDGRVRIRFKSAWKDGTHSVLLDPLDNIGPSVCTHPTTALSHAALPRHSRRPLAKPRGSGPARVGEGRMFTRTEQRRAAALVRARASTSAASAALTTSMGLAAAACLSRRHHDVSSLPGRHAGHRRRYLGGPWNRPAGTTAAAVATA
ncbi:MAG: hypothetical protein ACI9KE_004416 [Polyangiales bacterium]